MDTRDRLGMEQDCKFQIQNYLHIELTLIAAETRQDWNHITWTQNRQFSVKCWRWAGELERGGFDNCLLLPFFILPTNEPWNVKEEKDTLKPNILFNEKPSKSHPWKWKAGVSVRLRLRCQTQMVLYSPHPALTQSKVVESAEYVPASTGPLVRRAPPGWTPPASSGSASSHEHMMTELQQTVFILITQF